MKDDLSVWTGGSGLSGAWMPGNYHEGNTYSVEEQVIFSGFMMQALTQAKIPFVINSGTKFYGRETNQWIPEMQLVFQAVFSSDVK